MERHSVRISSFLLQIQQINVFFKSNFLMLTLSEYSVKAVAEFPRPKTSALSVPDVNVILFAHLNDNSVPCCTLCCPPRCSCLRERAGKALTLPLDPLSAQCGFNLVAYCVLLVFLKERRTETTRIKFDRWCRV